MSNMKHDAHRASRASRSCERVPIPDELIPADAQVEMEAKKAAGYFTDGKVPERRGAGAGRRAGDLDE